MSRSRDNGYCPSGKRNCGAGCSRADLNAVRDFRQTPVVDPDLVRGDCGCCPPPTAQDLEYEKREREYEAWLDEQSWDEGM